MLTFKCPVCKGTIIKSYPYDSSYIQIDKQLFHIECYSDKMQKAHKNRWTKEETPSKIEELVLQTKAQIEYANTREQLVRFLEKQYDIVFIPKQFFAKIESINNGTLDGLSKPIPIADLLDMWEMKIDWLKKQGLKKWKGDSVEALTRINYDLAVLMGKYPSYLNWKNGVKAQLEVDIENSKKQKTVQFVNNFKPQTNKNNKSNIVLSALDELFK